MPAALKRLETAISESFERAKRKGKLKGADKGAYVFGSKAVQGWRKKHGGSKGGGT
jgi:hypothetical protein